MGFHKGKTGTYLVGALTLVCLLALYSGISHSGVVGSPHDLSIGGGSQFKYLTDQVCVFCHTPHGANAQIRSDTVYNSTGYDYGTGDQAFLLWNRALSNQTSFSVYQSSTMDATTNEVRVYSLLCLSCHDGVSAMNVLMNYPYDTGGPLPVFSGGTSMSDIFTDSSTPPWGPNLGERTSGADQLNLSNDHPISIDYTASHPDVGPGGLKDPSTLDPAIKLFPNPSGSSTSIECSTCHDVHNHGSGAQQPFLVMSNEDSALCTSCHDK